jgi:hypothetical protein
MMNWADRDFRQRSARARRVAKTEEAQVKVSTYVEFGRSLFHQFVSMWLKHDHGDQHKQTRPSVKTMTEVPEKGHGVRSSHVGDFATEFRCDLCSFSNHFTFTSLSNRTGAAPFQLHQSSAATAKLYPVPRQRIFLDEPTNCGEFLALRRGRPLATNRYPPTGSLRISPTVSHSTRLLDPLALEASR